MFIIKDWAFNICFSSKEFDSFDDAEEFLSNFLGDNYDEDRGEYHITDNDETI